MSELAGEAVWLRHAGDQRVHRAAACGRVFEALALALISRVAEFEFVERLGLVEGADAASCS